MRQLSRSIVLAALPLSLLSASVAQASEVELPGTMAWTAYGTNSPPVALGAFAAATVAGARPMATGLQAMRLGSVIYFIPFLFVLNPGLIMQGEPLQIGLVFIQAVADIVLFASAMQGYLIGVGRLGIGIVSECVARSLVLLAGLMLALPGGGMVPLTQVELFTIALGALIPAVVLARWSQRQARQRTTRLTSPIDS